VVDFCEPQVLGPQYGAHGGAAAALSLLFTSRAAAAGGGAARLPSRKRRAIVTGTRTIGAADMVRHGRLGAVRVDPVSHEVTLDGEPLRSAPAAAVPLSQLYLLG